MRKNTRTFIFLGVQKNIIFIRGDIMDELSEKEIIILEIIKHKIASAGYSPTVREICEFTGIKSTSTIHYTLNKLEKKGYIEKLNGMPRTIRVCKEC